MKKKNKYLVDFILFILDLILDLIFILIFFIGPHIRKYLIFFFMSNILIFLFNNYSLYFGIISLDLDLLDSYLSFLYDLINNISIYLDFYFVMLILYSIFVKDVTLFNYLFCFFYYIYIFLDKK